MNPRSWSRRRFLQSAGSLAGGLVLRAADIPIAGNAGGFAFQPEHDIIPAPADPGLWPAFREQLESWRESKRRELAYSDALYRCPEFDWVTGNFACGFVMMYDETFYDHRAGQYTVAHFLEHGRREFGGYDSVVLWHAYPRIGLDQRNQFDFYRDMPGGLDGVRTVVRALQDEGVRVFINYNPWDTGTRREAKPDLEMLCDFVRELDVDGIFLDTMSQGAAGFRELLDRARSGVALESELALHVDRLRDHHFSWAQWFTDSPVPGVLRNKWFEPRHLQHQIKRWDHDHSGELHAAWMNGSGMMIWENVFGSWMGWSARDRSILRTVLPIQRAFRQLWFEGRWSPLVTTLQPDVYASLWELDGLRLWTLVNRSRHDVQGPLLTLDAGTDQRCFDLVAGSEIESRGNLSGKIHSRSVGCLVAVKGDGLPPGFRDLLNSQRIVAARFDSDTSFPTRRTRLVGIQRTGHYPNVPEGMIRIPGAGIQLSSELRIRECGFYDSNPPEQHQLGNSYEIRHVTFSRSVTLASYALDLTPVTNAQFAGFLAATAYRPRHSHHFLKHWSAPDAAGFPVNRADHPVVYVGLDDARAYAEWCGKRLPTEEEWQYAAAGPDSLRYPWGHEMLPNHCNDGHDTTPVTRFLAGRSPFGIYDLCGNVWEWTESERSDGRTRFCILKGGSYFAAQGSNWYMDGGPRPNLFAAKCLLLWPGLDRCATVGFRCAVD